ncbi:NAD(P)H-binding protein [Streptomyces sp. CA-111067]|uniref:NAD(P)H-binding protein n=1 Tax=Streptomyces sp. CA-111067 TaxID=3240046 RepID=UPI003D955BE7
MILVTGATGTIGSHVARQLTERGVPFRAMSRRERPDGVPGLDGAPGPDGAQPDWIRADFDDPASLATALTDIETVFLVTAPPTPTAAHDLALLTAARAAGSVRRIVKLSAIGTGEQFDGATVGAWHHAAEQAIEASGLAWTMLRPPSFASNVLFYRALIHAGEPIPNLVGDARQAIVDPRDVAAVAVAALTGDAHDGQRYTVTGPELLTFADQAAVLERVLERVLQRPVKVADAPGPDAVPAAIVTEIGWARAGGAAYVTDHVRQVLGRPAGTFEQWVRDHRESFAATP